MIIQQSKSTSVIIDGRSYDYFGGTNYLGLAQRPELMQAAAGAFEKYGFSSSASRLTSGETDVLVELEGALARFGQAESAIVLPAGYMANVAVVDALDERMDAWFVQAHAHASIGSALAQSRKPIMIVEDIPLKAGSLRERYDVDEGATIGVFIEPINPLTGELTDVRSFTGAAKKTDILVLDEAHSFGVLGQSGAGASELFNLQDKPMMIRTGTFSKAIGTFGGFVLASEEITNQIKRKSACFRASTAASPVACAATLESLRLIQEDRSTTTGRLKSNINTMNDALVELGFHSYRGNQVPIYHLSGLARLAHLQESLFSERIYIPAVGAYFAGSDGIGIRWTIQAGHTEAQLSKLLSHIAKCVER